MIGKLWAWLKASVWWIVCAFVVLFGAIAIAVQDARKKPSGPGTGDLAGALRPGMQKRADTAQGEALRRRQEAERAVADAHRQRERISKLPPADVLKESEAYTRKVRKRPPSRSGIWIMLLALFVSFANLARAQESMPEAMAHPESSEDGFWIPADIWVAALGDVAELEALQAALPRFRAALDAREAESAELRRAAEMERANADVLSLQLKASSERLADATRWYRSPKFLVPLGAVLGAALVALPLGLSK